MVCLIAALCLSFLVAFSRQISVFHKIELGFWLFANFYKVRLAGSLLVAILLVAGLGSTEWSKITASLVSLIIFFVAFAYFFDMRYFFPEIKYVERRPSHQVSIPGNSRIIGVALDDMAVAYPLDEVVIPRHLVNDLLGGTHVLVSYCALCRSALAFRAEIDGQPLYFSVSAVWRRNMVMIDSETGSLWQQATGECLYGKYKGRRLELLSGDNTTWQQWQEDHPGSEYAWECVEARRGLFSREFMLKALMFVTPKVLVPGFSDLSGMNEREMVFGISFNGVDRAYQEKSLSGSPNFEDLFGNIPVEINYHESSSSLTAKRKDNNQKLLVERHWWLGWKEFHPDTEIWVKKS